MNIHRRDPALLDHRAIVTDGQMAYMSIVYACEHHIINDKGTFYMSTTLPLAATEQAMREPFYREVLNLLPLGVVVYKVISPTDFQLTFINPYAYGGRAVAEAEVYGLSIEQTVPPTVAEQMRHWFQECIASGEPQTMEVYLQLPAGEMWTISTFIPVRDAAGQITHMMACWNDVTEEKLRERAEQQHREEIIDKQAATLAELSTPMLTISEGTVVMPLVGAVDSRRATQMMDALLQGVAESRASIVILDITGVSIVDTQVANAFVRASQAVQLLGAKVVLTGIRPEVAQTLVQLGVDLRNIITRATLRDGITYALQH